MDYLEQIKKSIKRGDLVSSKIALKCTFFDDNNYFDYIMVPPNSPLLVLEHNTKPMITYENQFSSIRKEVVGLELTVLYSNKQYKLELNNLNVTWFYWVWYDKKEIKELSNRTKNE